MRLQKFSAGDGDRRQRGEEVNDAISDKASAGRYAASHTGHGAHPPWHGSAVSQALQPVVEK